MKNHEIIMQAIREVANCETPEKFAESNQTVYNVAKRALEIANVPPVSIAEQNGEKGVRLCVGDVDIFIEAHNLDDGRKYEWEDAMNRLKEVGKSTFTKHEGTLIAAYIDLINEKLREIGGEELDGVFGSSTEYNSYNAWGIHSSGSIYTSNKYNSFHVRPCQNFKQN